MIVCVAALALSELAITTSPTAPLGTFSDALSGVVSRGYFATGPRWSAQAARLEDDVRSAPTIRAAQSPAAALVDLAGGRHSALLAPEELAASTALIAAGSDSAVPSVRVDGRVAVLRLSAFVAVDERQAVEYASSADAAIREARRSAPCGWVVDLRGNGGGTMLAMLAAVSPLLPDGRVMTVVDRAGDGRAVRVVGSSVTVAGAPGWVTGGFPSVKVSPAQVAVLTDAGTASAAEAVALAFTSSGTARSFGAATRGLTSDNEGFALPGGWEVRLTTGVYADVRGRTYVNVPLRPDVVTSTPLEAAEDWISHAGTC